MKKSTPLSPNQLKHHHQVQQQYTILDLHGKRRDAAIVAVTNFLDLQRRLADKQSSQCCWVTIITGTGSHSSVGPVLRSAVVSLLSRRNMEFIQSTPGSFCVNAQSGQAWYRQQQSAVDTKLLVAQRYQRTRVDPLVHLQHLNQKPRHQTTYRRAGYVGAARR